MNTQNFGDEHADLRAALQDAAARVPTPPFDAVLHASTIQRLEALAGTHHSRFSSRWPLLAAGTALLLALGCVGLAWHGKQPSSARKKFVFVPEPESTIATAVGLPPSPLAYERAAARGGSEFITMLDHDAGEPCLLSSSAASHFPSLNP